jgi:hypothetical protein
MSLLPLSLLFVIYAVWTYLWRSDKIRSRDVGRWDDPVGPVLLTSLLIIALTVQFGLKVGLCVSRTLDNIYIFRIEH